MLGCVRLFCDPIDCSLPGSSVHEIFQARVLEWVAIPTPGDLPDPKIEPESLASPALASGFFTNCATWEALANHASTLKTFIKATEGRRRRG